MAKCFHQSPIRTERGWAQSNPALIVRRSIGSSVPRLNKGQVMFVRWAKSLIIELETLTNNMMYFLSSIYSRQVEGTQEAVNQYCALQYAIPKLPCGTVVVYELLSLELREDGFTILRRRHDVDDSVDSESETRCAFRSHTQIRM
jgi:hypothetical protein